MDNSNVPVNISIKITNGDMEVSLEIKNLDSKLVTNLFDAIKRTTLSNVKPFDEKPIDKTE